MNNFDIHGITDLLFILVLDELIKSTTRRCHKANIGYNKLKTVGVSACAFADYLCPKCIKTATKFKNMRGRVETEEYEDKHEQNKNNGNTNKQ